MNGIHVWRQIPNIIILSGYGEYCALKSFNFKPTKAAFVTSTLLDALSVSAKKHSQKSLLLACLGTENDGKLGSRLQILLDLYFQHIIDAGNFADQDSIVNNITQLMEIH